MARAVGEAREIARDRDHVTGSLRRRAPGDPVEPGEVDADPRTAPACEGVRSRVVVGDEDQAVAFAALEVDGKRVLRGRGASDRLTVHLTRGGKPINVDYTIR